jgi:hypothetical protein
MDATGILSTPSAGNADFISALRGEPTLGELLADPLTRALMLADHVDGEAVAQMLHSVAGRLRSGAGAAGRLMTFDMDHRAEIDAAAFALPLWAPLERSPGPSGRFAPNAARGFGLTCGSHCEW